MLITCIVAPLALAGILGFSFAGGGANAPLTLGVSGTTPALLQAAEHAIQIPADVTVQLIPRRATLRREVARGTLAGGVILSDPHTDLTDLSDLLIPIVNPGATHSPGFTVLNAPSSLAGQQWAQSLAAGLASRLYAGRLQPGSATDRAAITIVTRSLGKHSKGVLDYFAPSIAVVFLFVGSGLGMRSLLLERSSGTLVRMAAAPIRANRIVLGKLAAILITALVSILVVWGVTSAVFGADWGPPLGVLLMCVGSALAMGGLGAFLASLAKGPQSAFGISLIVGLVLALLGGNLLPPGALPRPFQILALGTPNGWALVGFGRLTLLHDPASSAVDPFLVLLAIALVTGSLAMVRVRRMVRP
jgi:ABC-2 type transport system permease protein